MDRDKDISRLSVLAGTAVVLIWKAEKRVLIGMRTGSHGAGIFAFSGGGIEPNDGSLKRAGEREVLEETGIVCNIYKPDGIREELFTTYDILSEDGHKRYVTVYLLAEYISGGEPYDYDKYAIKPLEPHKCAVWHWVTVAELTAWVEQGGDKAWMPLDKVVPYLEQVFKE